jgi:methyl-accepting chemotaxis protein
MDNLKIRLALIASGLMFLALLLGFFAKDLARMAMSDQLDWWQMVLAAVGAVGICGIIIYTQLERALKPIIALTDHFMRMRAGDLDSRLPVEGPDEMQQMAKAFNETMSDIEVQIRDITEEKQAAERGRQFITEQLEASQQFKSLADALPAGLIMANKNLNVLYQNPASEMEFIQISEYLTWNADHIVGKSITGLFPEDDADHILSDPDNLPYQTSFDAGPYHITIMVNPMFSEEDDYLGPAIFWEVDLLSHKVDDDLPDLNESVLDELVEEAAIFDQEQTEEIEIVEHDLELEERVEEEIPHEGITSFEFEDSTEITHTPERLNQLIDIEHRLTRGTTLVGRSVRLLSDRLSTIVSMVEALCSEGDNLHHNVEETRQRTQNAAYLTTERSESLWELVSEMGGMEERSRATTMLVKRLKKTLDNSDAITHTIERLSDAIEHMVIEARLEVGRAGEAGAGMKIVVDEVRRLGRESARVHKDVRKRMDGLNSDVDDVLALLEEDRREVRASGRIARRAENALERIERDLSDVEERSRLLAEMTVGQSEIGSHIAEQLKELTELINVTQRVAGEQARIIAELQDGPNETEHRKN